MEGSRQSMGVGSLQALYSIPERKSSRHMKSGDSTTSITSHATPRHPSARTSIPPKGSSTSPIRRPSPVRRAPSRTYIPSTWPTDILASPSVTHSRVSLAIRLSSPVFIGGATVEGAVHIRIDGGAFEKRRKPKQAVSLRAASVTLTGVERCKGRQEIFRVLKSDLLDEEHPPPTSMALKTGLDGCWEVVPSDSILPFCLDLPVAIGPPPYKSKKIGISYWLSASLEFTLAGKEYTVRHSREIVVLTVHDRRSSIMFWKYYN